jgi:hypothetical protein
MEITKKELTTAIEEEIKGNRASLATFVIRGRVASMLGNQKMLDAVQKATEDTVKTLDFLNKELEKEMAGQ